MNQSFTREQFKEKLLQLDFEKCNLAVAFETTEGMVSTITAMDGDKGAYVLICSILEHLKMRPFLLAAIANYIMKLLQEITPQENDVIN